MSESESAPPRAGNPPRLRAAFTDPDEVASVYDGWASRYDDDLAAWGYDAPLLAARLLAQAAPGTRSSNRPVLDVGCGTGLVGRALRDVGFERLTGVDLSADSLAKAAETGRYGALHQVDFQNLPTAFADSSFAALVCVGVMTYLPDTRQVLTEFCRLVEPNGTVIFTQREDLWVERACNTVLEALEATGTAEVVEVSDPLDYLPGNDEMGDVGVVIVTMRSTIDSAN